MYGDVYVCLLLYTIINSVAAMLGLLLPSTAWKATLNK